MTAVRATSPPEATRRRHLLVRNPSLGVGLAILAAGIVAAAVGPMLTDDPLRIDLASARLGPGQPGHPLGTDSLGRDVLAWIVAGARTSLIVSVAVAVLSGLVGTVVGLVAGYLGGFWDGLLMRLVDLQLAIPPVLLFIAASVLASGTYGSLVILLSVVGWVPYARVVRSQVLSERERGHVAAARLAGSGTPRILVVHLLPQTASLVLVLATIQAGLVLLWESGLSFLGLGLQPPITSLGFVLAQGRADLATAWWVVIFPGLALALLVLAFNLTGDGLRDVLDVSEGEVG